MESIRVVIADDEALAREGLSLHLQQFPQVKLVASCKEGKETLDTLIELQPDIVFLDIEMPNIDGVSIVERLKQHHLQHISVVYVTAYDHFAANAFEQGVQDYLLKPINQDRLQRCIEQFSAKRAQSLAVEELAKADQLFQQRTGKTLHGVVSQLEVDKDRAFASVNPYLSVKSGTEWIRVPINQINWIESAGDYICLHTRDSSYIARHTLTGLEKELSPEQFCRVSRSAILNMQQVCKLVPNSNGEYYAKLQSGDEVKVSRQYKFKFKELTV